MKRSSAGVIVFAMIATLGLASTVSASPAVGGGAGSDSLGARLSDFIMANWLLLVSGVVALAVLAVLLKIVAEPSPTARHRRT